VEPWRNDLIHLWHSEERLPHDDNIDVQRYHDALSSVSY